MNTVSGGPSSTIPAGASRTEQAENGRLSLSRAMGSRILAGFALVLVGLPALAMLVVAISLAGSGEAAVSFFCAMIAFGLGWLAWSIGRIAFHRGAWIEIGPESMTVHHPIVLRRDLVVPRDQVRAAAVSTFDDPTWWLDDQFDLAREEQGFTVHAGREELRAALHMTARLTVPLVDENDLVSPNVIVVFEEPIRLSDARRGLRTGHSGSWVKRAEPDQIARGLLFRTDDPAGVRAAFDGWQVRNRLSKEDGDILVPTKEDIRRYRRFRFFSFLSAAWFVVYVVARLFRHISEWLD